ncbi:MAG TPA: type II and III secretion system protein, partial [bacterium]|nr:type II and III secretion system protein [bacterium]
LKVQNARAAEVTDKRVAAVFVISDTEVIVEGRKEGATALKITTKEGAEAVMVRVRKQDSEDRMIEIDVHVLEIVSGDKTKFGVDWVAMMPGIAAHGESGMLNTPLHITEIGPEGFVFKKFKRGPLNVLVDFLVTNNYAKVLAKPKLLASNGEQAQFLSGGELPLAVTDSLGKTSFEWKKYGVALAVKPAIKKKSITARLKAEVSNLDYGNAIRFGLGEGIVPALKTRSAETVITLEPDETVVIAGLLQDEDVKITSGVPVLSAIPLIGELFKNTHLEKKRTELVIFVTPRIYGSDEL